MREARRLALVRRQALIAGTARIAALRVLADSLGEERHSQALASRARALAAAGQPQAGAATAGMVAARLAHGAGLHTLAKAADEARAAAATAGVRHAGALAQAEARIKRLTELETAANAAMAQNRARQDAAAAAALARPVQRSARRSASPAAVTPTRMLS